jgi:hypothetical protein
MVEHTCEHLNKLKAQEIRARCNLDPTGENNLLAKHAGSCNWAVLQPFHFDYTSQDTPQHNSLVELAFPYLSGKTQATMGGTLVLGNACRKVAFKAVPCATQFDCLVAVEVYTTILQCMINIYLV